MFSRRDFLKSTSCGFGYVALASLAARAHADESPLLPKVPHFKPLAKHVIFMFMQGGPSTVERDPQEIQKFPLSKEGGAHKP